MRKLFLVVSISFLSLNSASASYLKHEDIITDQVDLVSYNERARAGKLKSPGGWEVKQTAYNAKTGLVEVVAQNNDKYSNIVLNPRSVSWSARLAGMVGSALSKGAGLFSWIPFLISDLADDGHNMYYDPDGYIKLRPKPEFQDRVRIMCPILQIIILNFILQQQVALLILLVFISHKLGFISLLVMFICVMVFLNLIVKLLIQKRVVWLVCQSDFM